MADSFNNQIMNCKDFVTFRNIFDCCATTRVTKWKGAAVFEFFIEDISNFHRAEFCEAVALFFFTLGNSPVFCRCQAIYYKVLQQEYIDFC